MADKGLVLVTGATGFVGKWTVIEALKAGYPVRGTVRSPAKAAAVRTSVSAMLGSDPGARLDFAVCDLLDDAGWAQAMAGVTAVLHTATLVLGEEPKDPGPVIRTAVEGSARVLRFAHAAGVKRVVITESIATVGYGHGQTSGKRVYDETYFTNLDNMRWTWAYATGKTRAERASWEFTKANGMEMTTIHPGAIFGPAIDEDVSVSVGGISGILDGTIPALPNLGISVIDVRDVAEMHIAALEKPESIGERYLATNTYVWFKDVAAMLQKAYPDRRIRIKILPDWLMRFLAQFGGPVRQIIEDIGNEKHYDGRKGEKLLGRPYRSVEEAVLSGAESVIRLGLVKEKKR